MIKNFCAILILTIAVNINVALAADRILDAPIFDAANLLTQNEIQTLTNKINAVERKHQIKIGIEFLQTIEGNDIGNSARYLLKQHYSGAQNGGIIFLVVMDQRAWYIATDSKMDYRIPNVNTIGNVIVGNLSGGDYYSACNTYIDAVDQLVTYYEQNGAAYDSSAGFNPAAAVVAGVMAIIFGIMIRSWLLSGMSNVKPQVAATDYLKRETVKMITNRDTYLFTNVTRRPKGGGGGGSHHGGGGHSGGGGGGHF